MARFIEFFLTTAIHPKVLSLCLRALLDSFEQSRRRVLAVALGIVAYPPPQIIAGIFEGELGLPPQLLVGARWVGGQVKNVACSPRNDFVLELMADDLAESIDHLEDSGPAPRAQVPCSHSGLLLSKVVQGCEMALGEIDDVNVVADGGTVSGGVVY